MNPFAALVETLARTPSQIRLPDEPDNRTGRMRQHLRDVGPATAAELGRLIGRSASRAASLLYWDIEHGRVIKDGRMYRWASLVERELHDAAQLLRRHGYRVEPPEGP